MQLSKRFYGHPAAVAKAAGSSGVANEEEPGIL